MGQSSWPTDHAFLTMYISKKRGAMTMSSVVNKKKMCDVIALLPCTLLKGTVDSWVPEESCLQVQRS